jgi:uncharacterized protein YbjT (DUF2867 family)
MKKKKLLIIGASGFVGEHLTERLLKNSNYEIYGISRSDRPKEDGKINWIKADLYSSQDIENALIGMDYAIYLVHSMSPTARLDQGNFQDYDIIMADNFSRAIKKSNVKQIIYLGGILSQDGQLSRHLLSRLEVENTLSRSGVPLTTLRAGMIIGQGGSSFSILMRFVEKMKMIPLPPWSSLMTQPIDIVNVLDYIEYCLENETVYHKSFDIAGDEILSYENLIKKICEASDLKRIYFPCPKVPTFIASYIFHHLTHSPEALVLPLMESVTHSIVAKEERLLNVPTIKKISLMDSIKKVDANFKEDPHAFIGSLKASSTVRSVQRMKLPSHMRADIISFSYLHWLPRYFRFLLKVEKDMQFLHIKPFFTDTPFLTLQHGYDKSERDRQVFYIRGGLLVKKNEYGGIMEFREILDGDYLIVAIHNFKPALPWWIYVPIQAAIHKVVMDSFSSWVNHLSYSTETE